MFEARLANSSAEILAARDQCTKDIKKLKQQEEGQAFDYCGYKEEMK